MVPFIDQDTHTHTQIILQVIYNNFTLFLYKNKIKITWQNLIDIIFFILKRWSY